MLPPPAPRLPPPVAPPYQVDEDDGPPPLPAGLSPAARSRAPSNPPPPPPLGPRPTSSLGTPERTKPLPRGTAFAPPPPPPGTRMSMPPAPPVLAREVSNGGGYANGYEAEEDDVPEPPAVVGPWTFPMKGMFPPPRPWHGGHK